MGLAGVYAGEVELDVVMDTFVALAGIDDAEEAVYLGLFSALVEATVQAQESGVATNRLAESLVDAAGVPIATAVAVMSTICASQATKMRRELHLYYAAATGAQRLATDGDNHNRALLGAGP